MSTRLLLVPALAWAAAGCTLAAAQQAAEAPVQPPSSLIQPALDSIAKAGSNVDLNRWKTSNAVRSDVDANLGSIQKDLQNALPALMKTSDAAPASISATMPMMLNLDALYSVLLRVAIASRGAAPKEENAALEQSLQLLDSARRDLGSAIVSMANAQESQVKSLQTTVKQQADALTAAQQQVAAASTASAQASAAKPKPKPVVKRKPIAKPASPAGNPPASGAPAPAAKPATAPAAH